MKQLASRYEKAFFIDAKTEPCNVVSNSFMVWDIEGPLLPYLLQQAIIYGFGDHYFHYDYSLESENLYKKLNFKKIEVPYFDFSNEESPEVEFTKLLSIYYNKKIILESEPLFKGAICKIANKHHKVIIMAHHICLDGTGFQAFFSKVQSAYQALELGQSLSTTSPSNRKTIEAKAISESDKKQALEFWKNTLNKTRAKTDFSHAVYSDQRRVTTEQLCLGSTFSHDIKSYCRNRGLTVNLFFKGVFALLVSRIANQPMITVTSPMDRRTKSTRDHMGCYVNTRLDFFNLKVANTLDEYWSQIKKFNRETKAYGELPYIDLIQFLKQESEQPESMVSNIAFGSTVGINESQMLGEECYVTQNYSFFELNADIQLLFCESSKQSYNFRFDYLETFQESRIFENFLDRFHQVLCEILTMENQPLYSIPILTPNDSIPQLSYSCPKRSLAELIHVWVKDTPLEVAIFDTESNRTLNYKQLHERVSNLAFYLSKIKSTTNNKKACVAINLSSLTDTVVAILATQYVGLAFTCVDCSAPKARQQIIIDQLSPMLLIGEGVSTCAENDYHHLPSLEMLPKAPIVVTPSKVSDDSISQYIFTSGTTGQPKAVALSHRAFVTTLFENPAIPVGSRVLYSANEAFDAASLQLWLALLHGRSLIIPKRNEIANPEALEHLITNYAVDHMFLTTGLFETYMSSNKRTMFNNLETLVFGGDSVSKQAVERGLDCNIKNLINIYGPTETTIYVTSHRCTRNDLVASSIPIGTPRPNAQVWIVDDDDQQLGIGMVGHIIVAGDCLSQGYVGDSIQNEKFCYISINGSTQRVYRTGDYGYVQADGVIVFKGRKDDQIKLRGYRIELTEIRQALQKIPEIQMAAVLLKETSIGKQLIGYYQSPSPLDTQDLRAQLETQLPSYMIPAHLIHQESMPLNRNGKLDKSKLAEPQAKKEDSENLNKLQLALLEQACAALEVPALSIYDDFVNQGGDSISAILLSVGLEEKGMKLSTADIMKYRVFDDMARKIVASQESELLIGEKQGDFNLLPAQKWFFNQNFERPEHFNQAITLQLPKSIERDRLHQALTDLTEFHDSFQLRFNNHSRQTFVAHEHAHFELYEMECEQWEHVETEIAALNKTFNLQKGPLFKALLFWVSEEDYACLYLCAHHLIVDGVSWRRIASDLEAYYKEGSAHQPVPYSNTQAYQSHWEFFQSDEEEVAFWLKVHKSSPSYYYDLHSFKSRCHNLILDESQTNLLVGKANAPYGTNTNELLIATLYKIFAQNGEMLNLLIEGHGRKYVSDSIRCDATIGWFTSIFPLCLPSSSPNWSALIKRTKQSLRSLPNKGENYLEIAFEHQEESVRETLQSLLKLPISFNFLGRFTGKDKESWHIQHQFTQHLVSAKNKPLRALDINAWICDDKLHIEFDMVEEAFSNFTVVELSKLFSNTLQELIEHCISADCLGGLTPSDLVDIELAQEVIENLEEKLGTLEDIYPATDFQRELLYFNRVNNDYQIDQLYFELTGELNIEAFKAAWGSILLKYDILRAGFDDEHTRGQPLILIPRSANLPITLQNWENQDIEQQISDAILNERQRPFDWHKPPLMRLLLANIEKQRHILLFTFNHVLFDGWSMQIFLKEVMENYEKLLTGKRIDSDKLRFVEFQRWLSSQPNSIASQYWENYMLNAQMNMRVPSDNPTLSKTALRIQCEKGGLDEEKTGLLRQAALSKNATLNQYCQLAWASTLSKRTQSLDIVFGTTLTKRPVEVNKVTELVGLFVATPPLRIPLQGSIANMIENLNESSEQRVEYAFHDLNDYDQDWRPTAPFGTLFVFENYPEQKSSNDYSLKYHHLGTVSGTNHQIVLCVFPGEMLEFSLFYDGSEISQELASNIAKDYQEVLFKLIEAEKAEDFLLI
ncbi:hypothetical protein BTO01_04200 [Vibrio jasicida]|uniref:condensation domain-containing protein n=1 Tax=Vibrio jasicida TaxID=766224 RepID=UPI000CF4B9CE|nr:condensation domain-containing protein [Vibrio jasicida]PQJ70522.1 hypothetical protein BTO01_04200 [Vibrio jasicida]